MLDAFSAAGHPEECRERLAEFEAVDGVDAVAVSFPREGSQDELAETAAALSPT
jgi:alkanesulfonate monooxygenase SsuD/methylene tetrahydromethanopterin reductase-like flavin-dependent oxidoreductase (luciferase family)